MPSKTVLVKEKSAKAVIKAIEANSAPIGEILNALFQPVSPVTIDYPTQFSVYAAKLSADYKSMVQADEADINEGLDDAEPLKRRDELTQALYDKMVSLRRTVIGLFGEDTARAIGFRGEISRDAQALVNFASEVSTAASKLNPPTPLIEGASLDLKVATSGPLATAQKLEVALSDVAREIREGQQSLSAKNTAITRYDATFSAITRIVEALYRLAGAHDLADKLRPSSRRPGTLEDEPQDTNL